MRKISTELIIRTIKDMCIDANYHLGKDVIDKIKESERNEESPIGKDILNKMIINTEIAKNKQIPICQDTGMAVFFIEIGQDVYIEGGSLTESINEGVRQGYKEGYLRKSVVEDPLIRKNTNDNTPAVIHYDIVKGDKLKISFAPKGFGSENMGALKMLKPSDGVEGVKRFIIETVEKAGPNPCPPIVVGVGIGGTMEKSCELAKKALLREIDKHNEKPHIKDLEIELLEKINNLGIGPQGLGGRITALAVNIETFPTHIAGLPVAVNINCHVARHVDVIL
ncbi:hydro-lyase, Fe-S type, tartrate/fumarate subfamily [Gottschalkia purinilytica]|uniref:Hydro-lyase, Fe-S type, tartrate/fumarate subfamily n=1 Tax=Gottschalkia purinilytica TaxID=1503 RepID=A0A0L0WEI4_GOTPU|nr:fumarate hydratase [Gottschalkia purinilytica]KNF09835.1 hydro-lyase, Fe-S type, tartrate/fumarate subfamily [Gottschalkia purinilytica]